MKQYQPLYLKYRPQNLSELIGQEVVTKTLTNAILYKKIVHAYLFCGPRGTGKTSCARILAKSINCESGITATPCDKCVSCKSIIEGNSLDVIEIDAASHRKVEDAEDLINRVNLGTYGSRFKIYIIDEVHMLTDHAFNALLKTLEEPPNNVIFILATTEEYKVIPTIVSRCQKLDFKPVSPSALKGRIKGVAKQEKINIDDSVISFISKRSYGCMIDAISILDQISVLQEENKPIDHVEVFKLFGTVDRTSLFNLAMAILSFNKKDAVELAEDFIKSGKDIGELFKDLLELVVDLAKAKIDPEFKKVLSLEISNDLSVLDQIQQGHLLKIIDRLHASQSNLRFALSQELQFIVEVMSMMDEDFLISMSELKERIEKLEPKVQEQELQVTSQKLETEIEPKKEPVNSDIDALWNKIISLIDSNPTRTLLMQSESYLININNDLLEIGLSKDMFLPRLEKDTKKKEMILKAAVLASSFTPQVIRFRVLPRTNGHKQCDIERNESPTISHQSPATSHEPANEDDFTRAVKDLLGAKEI